MSYYNNSSIGSSLILDEDFVPGPKHIIISRRKKWCLIHEGNMNFQMIIERRLDDYSAAENNKERKSEIIMEILNEVHSGDFSEGFVKHDPLIDRFFVVEAASGKLK